jgi:hypothetical protein
VAPGKGLADTPAHGPAALCPAAQVERGAVSPPGVPCYGCNMWMFTGWHGRKSDDRASLSYFSIGEVAAILLTVSVTFVAVFMAFLWAFRAPLA